MLLAQQMTKQSWHCRLLVANASVIACQGQDPEPVYTVILVVLFTILEQVDCTTGKVVRVQAAADCNEATSVLARRSLMLRTCKGVVWAVEATLFVCCLFKV